mmetsp:Transcript_16222/g.49350  ORF Transcript_16222/g.49350 Transcript_16222/m.49350 type:complete len:105 (-) Transcript_16222:550-864(-)
MPGPIGTFDKAADDGSRWHGSPGQETHIYSKSSARLPVLPTITRATEPAVPRGTPSGALIFGEEQWLGSVVHINHPNPSLAPKGWHLAHALKEAFLLSWGHRRR